MNGPDFSAIDSREKHLSFFSVANSKNYSLAPQEFGGAKAAHNILYVPIGIAAIKASTDAI